MTDVTENPSAQDPDNPTASEFMQGALQRAGNSDVVAAFTTPMQALLEKGEVVLEAAETTAPGHLTAVFATNRRVVLFVNLETVREARYENITHVSGTSAGDMALELSIFDRTVKWEGFGQRGLRRIISAVTWAKHEYAPHGNRSKPSDHMYRDIFSPWMKARRELGGREDITPEEYSATVGPILDNKRWW